MCFRGLWVDLGANDRSGVYPVPERCVACLVRV